MRGWEYRVRAVIRFVAWVWLGIVVGVSFLATPIKFTAESLTRPVALDVGRATFHLLNQIECILTLVLVALVWRSAQRAQTARPVAALVGLVAVIVVAQTFWLLPELDARVESIIDGVEPSPSILHTVFGVLEVAKVAALGIVGHLALADQQSPVSAGLSKPASTTSM